MLLAFTAGVAWAAFAECPGGRCEGTMDPDQIDGSEVRDFFFTKAGDDDVEGGDGNEGATSSSGTWLARATASSARGATTSWTPAMRMASKGSTAAKATTRPPSTPATGWQPTARLQPKWPHHPYGKQAARTVRA